MTWLHKLHAAGATTFLVVGSISYIGNDVLDISVGKSSLHMCIMLYEKSRAATWSHA